VSALRWGDTDPPLVAGTVVGCRYWHVGRMGHLFGFIETRHGRQHYVEGENEARHVRTVNMYEDNSCGGLASTRCRCGFHAAFDLHDCHVDLAPDRVRGIIEGYGTVSLGRKGFRCSKARVLALIRTPDDIPTLGLSAEQMLLMGWDLPNRHAERIKAQYPHIPWFDTLEQATAEFPLTKPEELLGVKDA